MTIQWYPGHMKKARDEMTEAIDSIDVVIELIDARLPASSRNPVLDELRRNKPCIRLLNKSDLADPSATALWVSHMEQEDRVHVLDVEGHDASLIHRLPDLCRKQLETPLKRAVRAMVVGIPNVGKSTLINTLAGRKLAKVGNQPAITRHKQTIHLKGPGGPMDVSDTPGILWPNLADKQGAYRLAVSGAVRDTVVDFEDVAYFGCHLLLNRYPALVLERYGLKETPKDAVQLLEDIGRKRGCLMKGGRINLHKAAELFIQDFRSGKIGRISLEIPDDLDT